jgi:RNA polymerase sigma-70 factor (ECF subfamily)
VSDADARDAVQAASGDVAAFERLYGRHASRVHSLARRMLGGEQADDATQDVFIRAWEKLGMFRGDAAFGTWLTRLALNVVLRRRQEDAHPMRMTMAIIDEPPAQSVNTDATMDVTSALQRLDPALRDVVVLHDIEGYGHEEIGDLLGITLGASKMRLMRARQALRAYLGEETR